MEGRTTLTFAHRLSSVIGADRIMVLDGGRLAESGTHAELMTRRGPYWRLMNPQVSAARSEHLIAIDGTSSAASAAEGERAGAAVAEDGAVSSKTMGWLEALPILIRMIRGYRARLVATFGLGIARVAAIIAVGVLSALVVRAVKHDAPFGALLVALAMAAPLAGLLHWLESWLAHDMAYRLLNAALSPLLRRAHIDQLGSRAREVSGDLSAHTVDSIQGMAEIVAFQRERARGEELTARARAYLAARMPFLADLTREHALHEAVTGLGGLAIIAAGAWMVAAGRLDGAMLPLLTLLALSAFIPLWEVGQVGRQLADTLGATRRTHAIDSEQ